MTSQRIVSVKANNYTQSGSRLLDWSVLYTPVSRRPLLQDPGVMTNGQPKFIKTSALPLAGKRGFSVVLFSERNTFLLKGWDHMVRK